MLTASRTDSNVHANLSVTASFAINTYTLTYTAGANGSISGTSPQTVNDGGSGSAVTAVADAGYHFTSWSDGVLTASRTDSNVHANLNVTASFAIDTTTNAPPVITGVTGPAVPVAKNTQITVTATFTDANYLDTHTCTISWDDLTSSVGTVVESNGSGSCIGSHIYTAAGVYEPMVTVTDNFTAWDTDSFQYVVVYDIGAGFVTGGGWIDSKEGYYVENTSMTGKANFGFVSKYKPGMTVPTGETEFNFNAAGFRFNSTAYEWLVVSGAKAQYKGTGTIKGRTGTYNFILTAWDGQVSGGGGIDRFRIRIYDGAGQPIYDNQLGAPDNDNPTTALGGGSIVIHK